MTAQLAEHHDTRKAVARAGPTATTALVYGFLFPSGGWGKWLGRQGGLPAALSAHMPVVVLELSRHSSSRRFGLLKPVMERREENLYVIRNAMSVRTSRFGKRLGGVGGSLDGGWLNQLLAESGFPEYVYWMAQADPRLLWGMKTDRLVYDCYDPAFLPETQAGFDRSEFAVARAARVVFASAHTLRTRMQQVHRNVHLLPNACSGDSLASAAGSFPRPERLRDIKTPIIGCMSTYDWRVDAGMLLEAARRLPQYTFALVGRVNQDQESRISQLRAMTNVIFPGQVSYEEGLQWSHAFDVGLIPFLPGAISDAVNPVKMYMYLAGGKPVVTTWINECALMAPMVKACRTAEEFAAAIRGAVAERSASQVEERMVFARRNRWEERASYAMDVLREAQIV